MLWKSPTESGPTQSQPNSPDVSPSSSSDDPCTEDGFSVATQPWSQIPTYRSYFLPLHYTPSYAYPLIVWLHHNGHNENQIDQVMPHISLRNYIGVGVRGTRAADSAGHRFDWHQGPAAIAAAHEAVCQAVDEAQERFSVNTSRVMLAGYHDGGTMAMRIAMRDPQRFAGTISLGGRMPTGGIRNFHQLRERRLPMLWQWAQDNPQYTESNLKTDFQSVLAMGGKVEVRQYLDESEMNTVVLRDIDDWIMRRIVCNSTVADNDRWATSPTLYSNN